MVLSTDRQKTGISVILPNFNYGRYLDEAIRSVLAQTIKPDEIIIIDDASSDDSKDIMLKYADQATLVFNEKNLGTVENFKKAVALSSGEFVAILDTDNLMRNDFLEKSLAALRASPDAVVAYTDMLIFGEMAAAYEESCDSVRLCGSLIKDRSPVYIREFPEPDASTLRRFARENFIHGNSMYRRSAYDKAGGYRETNGPEDFDLFKRMVVSENHAVHVKAPVLEYRQHSPVQRNNLFHPTHDIDLPTAKELIRHLLQERDTLLDASKALGKEIEKLKKNLTSKDRQIAVLRKALDGQRKNVCP